MKKNYQDIIKEYRKKVISGKLINLVPANYDNSSFIISLRNNKDTKYFLDQHQDLLIEQQKAWFDNYFSTNNDIYWCVSDKNNILIGTFRLYDFNFEKDCCEQGSIIIDEKYRNKAPFAKECEILTLDFAFNVLEVKNIINNIKLDNDRMNTLAQNIGFKFKEVIKIEDKEYNNYFINKESYDSHKKKFVKLINGFNEF